MFISIDGPDGSGKSTVARRLCEVICERDGSDAALYTCEPTDSTLGVEIRRILKAGDENEKARLRELFLEDRRLHIEEFILPHSQSGKVVVCDRYKYSTVCYQHLQGHPIEELVVEGKGFMSPDLAFILCTDDIKTLVGRIASRGAQRDFFETEALIRRSAYIYMQMPGYFPDENIVLLDSREPVDRTIEIILEMISYAA